MATETDVRQRQRSLAACDECRHRKLKCDGQQPQCGACQQSGRVCETSHRAVRGPKKGYVKSLKDRIAELESVIHERDGASQHGQQANLQSDDSGTPLPPTVAPSKASDSAVVDHSQSSSSTASGTLREADGPRSHRLRPERDETPTLYSTSNASGHIPDLILAELDQLYWDRVHASVPILHQRRYTTWSNSKAKSPAQVCLQYSMRTLACLFSAQFHDRIEPLYRTTKRMLETLNSEADGYSDSGIELPQAWVLVAICESMRTHHRQAFMSAGQVFRYVQGLRFHEIDSPENEHMQLSDVDNLVDTEEQRRVFWMAYLIDHMFSVRNDWPVTLNEHMICTRLPATDLDFQRGHSVSASFISEALTDPSKEMRSPFTECIIFVTICGRSLLQAQKHKISSIYGDATLDWEGPRQWLDSILTTRLQGLNQHYPSQAETHDPLLLFAHVLSQATVIYLCKSTMEARPILASDDTEQCRERALQAAEIIVQLGEIMHELHFSKIHPLMPLPLFFTAEFLYDNVSTNESFRRVLGDLADVLRGLKNVNNHEQSYLDLLPRSCVSKSAELLNYGVEVADDRPDGDGL